MKWKRDNKIISYFLFSAFIFAALFFLTFRGRNTEAETTVQLLTFGDSVFGEVRDETAIPAQLANRLGMTCYNASFGGTRLARGDGERRLDYSKDSLSLVALAKSIEADDFGVQQTIRTKESITEYFEETIDGLETIDFSKVELILIQQGLNDYYSGVPVYNEDNPYDEYSFTGALRTSLTILREMCPNARIVIVTPTYTWHVQAQMTCEEFNAGHGLMEDYVKAEKEVAEEFGVELIDLYHDVFPHEQWSDWELYMRDGIHPNEAGRALLAEKIVESLE